MLDVDPRGERATRDIVARAIFATMTRTQHPNVYLDLSHLDTAHVHERFPGIAKVCAQFGLDIARDRIPVRPGAHYTIGGVTVDLRGATTLPALWAAGEVSSSGLHGANRLASNSLLEGLVFGESCGRLAGEVAASMPDRREVLPLEHRQNVAAAVPLDAGDIANSLRSLMTRQMGIVREARGLAEARGNVDFWCQYVLPRPFDGREGWELQNILILARLMIAAATERTESRGGHYRSDYPERDDANWVRHITSPRRE
jgi:L-aspartate oxidase